MRSCLVLSLTALSACAAAGTDSSTAREPARDSSAARAAAPIVMQHALIGASGADTALAAIRRSGAQHVLDSLNHQDNAAYDRYDRGFASGDSLWLEVARALRPATDGETAESLVETLAVDALPHAPRLVLRLIADSSSGFDRSICNADLYDAMLDSVVLARTAKAIAALRTVDEPELRSLRDTCLRENEAVRAQTLADAGSATTRSGNPLARLARVEVRPETLTLRVGRRYPLDSLSITFRDSSGTALTGISPLYRLFSPVVRLTTAAELEAVEPGYTELGVRALTTSRTPGPDVAPAVVRITVTP